MANCLVLMVLERVCIVCMFVAVVCVLLIVLRRTVAVFTQNIYPQPLYVYTCLCVCAAVWLAFQSFLFCG